jgi:hypothetical protein
VQRKTYIGSVEMRAADVWSHPHHELYRRWVKLFDAHCEPQGSLLVTLTVLAPGEIEYVHSVEQERAHALVVQRHEGAPDAFDREISFVERAIRSVRTQPHWTPFPVMRSEAYTAAPSHEQAAVVYVHATVLEGCELLPGDEKTLFQAGLRVSLPRSRHRDDSTSRPNVVLQSVMPPQHAKHNGHSV